MVFVLTHVDSCLHNMQHECTYRYSARTAAMHVLLEYCLRFLLVCLLLCRYVLIANDYCLHQ
jgi:hypothetical protein